MNPTDTFPDILERPDQFAQRINQSRAQVYKYLAEGMPSLKLNTSRRIDPAEALDWLRQRAAQ